MADHEQPPAPPQNPSPPAVAPRFKKAEVLRDFRKNLAKPNPRGGGRGRPPSGGNPRFR